MSTSDLNALRELLNTTEAAATLGVSVRRVRQLISEKKLSAQRVGRDYAIEARALTRVKIYGRPGRPAKPDSDPGRQSTSPES